MAPSLHDIALTVGFHSAAGALGLIPYGMPSSPACLQAFVCYPKGTADEGRTAPTAWFKGGPRKVDVHATNASPVAVTYIKM